MSWDGLTQKRLYLLCDPRKLKLGRNESEIGKGEKPMNNMVMIRLLLWPKKTQSHWVLPGKSHAIYPKITSPRNRERGLFNQTVILTGWGLSLGAWTPWHFWAAVCGWSPQAENQRDTGAWHGTCQWPQELSAHCGKAQKWIKAQWAGRQQSSWALSHLLLWSRRYQHSSVSSSLAHGFL